jgi:hypothetical protein
MMIPTVEQATPGETIRAKWVLDGAATLGEAAQRAREAADRLQALHDAGWTLAEPVDSDYGFLVDPSGNAGTDADDADDQDDRAAV